MPVDFVKNAESLGAQVYRADTRDALRNALQAAAQVRQTVLIYVPVDVDAKVPSFEGWWDVPVAEVSGEKGVQSSFRAYQEAKQKQRLYF
jgi:3D-(3,5/4)-trihydroxycyclohexane-1,2-dione acylhydrolase (decyclizing)